MVLLPVIIAILVLLNYFFNYFSWSDTAHFGLWGEFQNMPWWFNLWLAPLLVFCIGFGMVHLFNTHSLLDRNIYITGLLYVVYFSFYHSFYQFDGQLLCHAFFVLLLFQLFRLQPNTDCRKPVFNAAFLTGLIIAFHPGYLTLTLFTYLAILVMRPIQFREFFLYLAGLAVSLLYPLLYGAISNQNVDWQVIADADHFDKQRLDFLVTSSLFVATTLLAVLALTRKSQKTGIRTKKIFRMLLWLSAGVILSAIADGIGYGQTERFALLLIPLSIFLTYAFSTKTYFPIAKGLFYLVLLYTGLKFFI